MPLSYGKVVGRYVFAVGDSTDPGTDPDVTPAAGTATFTPSASRLLDTTTEPPTTVVPKAVVCTLNANGEILDPAGNIGVYLLATDDPDTNPTGWTWKVRFQFTGHPSPLSFSFQLPTDETIDLTEVTPLPNANGTLHLVGPAGPQGPPGTSVLGELVADTVDTATEYRLILFSNGTVKAIPVATPDPLPATNLNAVAAVASVTLTWTAATLPTSGKTYRVYRDGVLVATTSNVTYRDNAVVTGNTYSYTVVTVDAYGQVSAATSAATAFVDPALNQPPVVTSVTAWPPAHFTDGKTLIRVNASDLDGQALSLELGVDSGFLEPTDDPSVWYYTPA